MKTVILAGGEGRRLRPYTTVLPKPLMPVGDRPILDLLIGQLRQHGIDEVIISVGYLGGLIEAYVGDGSRLGVKVSYLREEKPLGTVGPISLLQDADSAFLVINGDVLTDFDFSGFARFHKNHGGDMSIGTYAKEVKIDLGVLELTEKGEVTNYIEKPTLKRSVSMGIYCCGPSVLDFVPKDSYCDLPTLVLALIRAGKKVRSFDHGGLWLDIGRHEDYEVAQEKIGSLLPALDY